MAWMTIVETIGMLTGVAGVWLTVRQHVACWPLGLVSVALYTIVFFNARLYGSAALQVVYLGLLLYGWHAWLHPDAAGRVLRVSRTPAAWAAGLAGAGVVVGLGAGWWLDARTDASLPYLDAGATAVSLAAQFLATRKWIETWILWVVVDVVYVGMYVSQRLYPTTALYGVFLALAVLGYREWKASMAGAQAAAVSADTAPGAGA